jgi:hypothetical protein
MEKIIENLEKSVEHIKSLNEFFSNPTNYDLVFESDEYEFYEENLEGLKTAFSSINLYEELYNPKSRQMILADLFEYIFLGRGFYAIGNDRKSFQKKQEFTRGILHFVNLLMSYESLTVEVERRGNFLDYLSSQIPEINLEDGFDELRNYDDVVGIPKSGESKSVRKYFDKLLPKTAGGLWHELLVYIIILRNNLGYILPLLLHQKIYSRDDHLIPPDFFILTTDKKIFGIEVGYSKEIQLASFSFKTGIPILSVDTRNSRNSDRCPICNKWIGFCPIVIERFSDFEGEVPKNPELKCLTVCNIFSDEEIISGKCKYSKYARKKTKMAHTQHNFNKGFHYHYKCVLDNVGQKKRKEIINAEDITAIKTHLPHYDVFKGLE